MINTVSRGRTMLDVKVNEIVNFKITKLNEISDLYTKKEKFCFDLIGDSQHKLVLKFKDVDVAKELHKNVLSIMALNKKHNAKMRDPLVIDNCLVEVTLKTDNYRKRKKG